MTDGTYPALMLSDLLAEVEGSTPAGDENVLNWVSARLRALPMPDAERAGERLLVMGTPRPAPPGHAARRYQVIGERSGIHYTVLDITIRQEDDNDPAPALETWGLILQISLNGPRLTHAEEIEALGELQGMKPWACPRCGQTFTALDDRERHSQLGC